MDIGKAFSFVTDDPKWVTKVLIGGGLILAGYLAIFTVIGWLFVFAIVFGYLVHLTRNVIAGEGQPLPEWANWGNLMVDGFKSFVVTLVLSLPLILVYLIFFIPAAVLNGTSDTGSSGAGAALSVIGSCVALPLALLVSLVSPIGIARYATTGNIGRALNIGAIVATLRANFVTYLLVLLMGIVTGFVSGLGVLACFIGLPFTAFYAQLVNYHLYGQAYHKAEGALPSYGQPQQPYPQSSPF